MIKRCVMLSDPISMMVPSTAVLAGTWVIENIRHDDHVKRNPPHKKVGQSEE